MYKSFITKVINKVSEWWKTRNSKTRAATYIIFLVIPIGILFNGSTISIANIFAWIIVEFSVIFLMKVFEGRILKENVARVTLKDFVGGFIIAARILFGMLFLAAGTFAASGMLPCEGLRGQEYFRCIILPGGSSVLVLWLGMSLVSGRIMWGKNFLKRFRH